MSDSVPLPEINARSKASFEAEIAAQWRRNVGGILRVGELLNGAELELDSDVFAALKLPFGPRTSQMLRRVAAHPIISKTKHASLLPACWSTLYELTKVDDNVLVAALADGRIHPGLQRKDIRSKILGLPPSGVKHPAPKITDIVRKALSLVATADRPETSPATAAANKNEAITALRCAIAVLACSGLDVNDLVLSTKGAAKTKSRSRAA
jgi:hypothetical protein